MEGNDALALGQALSRREPALSSKNADKRLRAVQFWPIFSARRTIVERTPLARTMLEPRLVRDSANQAIALQAKPATDRATDALETPSDLRL
jgi:hypothetical protein